MLVRDRSHRLDDNGLPGMGGIRKAALWSSCEHAVPAKTGRSAPPPNSPIPDVRSPRKFATHSRAPDGMLFGLHAAASRCITFGSAQLRAAAGSR